MGDLDPETLIGKTVEYLRPRYFSGKITGYYYDALDTLILVAKMPPDAPRFMKETKYFLTQKKNSIVKIQDREES